MEDKEKKEVNRKECSWLWQFQYWEKPESVMPNY